VIRRERRDVRDDGALAHPALVRGGDRAVFRALEVCARQRLGPAPRDALEQREVRLRAQPRDRTGRNVGRAGVSGGQVL
jgi:hypothetical protein